MFSSSWTSARVRKRAVTRPLWHVPRAGIGFPHRWRARRPRGMMGAIARGWVMATRSDAVVGRVRRPSWRDPRLLVGIALIALAVAAVVLIVQRSDTTEPFYAAARD